MVDFIKKMKKRFNNFKLGWEDILCKCTGHHLFYVQRFGHTQLIACNRCCKYFGKNDDLRCILPWSDEFEKRYVEIFKVDIKR